MTKADRINQTKENIINEASRQGIKSFVDLMSTSLTIEAKRTKILRMIEDLQMTYEDTA